MYGAASWFLPQNVAVVLATAAGIWLTGAFHEDGFADVCDGFGGGMTTERVLEIMKDSRVGAYGAIGICLLLLFKINLLSAIEHGLVWPVLLITHPLSRLASCSLIWQLNYARLEGKAKPLAQHMSHFEFLIAAISVLLPVTLIVYFLHLPILSIVAGLIALCFASFWLARLFVRRIDGYTGDCLGAVQQLAEVAFYLGFLIHWN